jgi:hypothetical protein
MPAVGPIQAIFIDRQSQTKIVVNINIKDNEITISFVIF